MALFSRTKKTEKAQSEKKTNKGAETALSTDRNLASVLVKPHVTEKAVGKSEQNVYTFQVSTRASKYDVSDAIKALYNVTPVRVNIVNKSPRKFMSRNKGRVVSVKGMKKAYVYLKKGDSITLV